MKKKINIGFDIGTTSVGWSIIDEDNNILDMGVRLFDDPANPKDGTLANAKRRESRTTRRRISRTRTRKSALIKFLIEQKWINSHEEMADLINIDITEFGVDNPVELKVKALKGKISKEQLIFILFHYIHHRGYFYITDEMLKNEAVFDENNTNPSEELLEFYKKNNYYINAPVVGDFSSRRYSKEIRRILEVQGIDNSFIERYLEIFNAIRDYSQGPGSKKSPTKYGMYYLKNGEVVKKDGDNLWDVTVGKCTYTQQNRGLKNSPIAELFNLLNDINNISVDGENKRKLSENEKRDIYSSLLEPLISDKKAAHLSIKLIEKSIDAKTKELIVKGFRIDKDKKAIFTKLENYSALIKFLINNKLWSKQVNLFDLELLQKCNSIFTEMARYNDALKRLEYIKTTFLVSNETAAELVKQIKGLTQTHSLSYEAMLNFIKNCQFEEQNSMQFFSKVYGDKVNERFANKKYLPEGIYDDEVISPTARRAFNQNIKVMNKIIKLYGKDYELNNITFEMARDKNSKEERESITSNQKETEAEIKSILDEHANGKVSMDDTKRNGIRQKLKLWKEQEYIDIYDGERIEFEDILNGSKYEIEHIIPYSISNTDARYNKVLTKRYLNKEKGDNTPYQWLSSKGKFEDFKTRVEIIIKNDRKKEYLLYMDDPIANMDGFIERNLVDTRYASRVVLNVFQDFFAQNKEIYPNVKTKVINGAITSYSRKKMFNIYKRREEYNHHAIDATIVNYLGSHQNMNKLVNRNKEKERELLSFYGYSKCDSYDNDFKIVNNQTGEIIDLHDLYKTNDTVIMIKKQIEDFRDNNKVKFSRQLRTKKNVQLSHESVYSFKWKNDKEGNIISKYKLLGKDWKKDFDCLFLDSALDTDELNKLMVYELDKTLYIKLKTIYNQFYDEKINPFIKYMKYQYDIENPTFVKIGDQKVSELRYIGDSKNMDIDDVIVLKKNHHSNAIMKSLNSISIRIYKDENGKYLIIPINQKCLKYKNGELILDEDELSKILQRKQIVDRNFINLNTGSILLSKTDQKIFYVAGCVAKAGLLDIKALFADNKDFFKRAQMQVSLSTVISEYSLAEVDVLGNIYNIKEIVL